MGDEDGVPIEVLGHLRGVCLGLPEAYEEPAWIGTRWRIRTRTFAHVLTVDRGEPQAHARAAGIDGDGPAGAPVVVMTFRSSGPELEVLRASGHPFFYAGWGRDVMGMVLDDGTDWDEVTELLTESYCVLAPKKLIALVERPAP